MMIALLLAAGPMIVNRGATHELVLPPAMRKALEAYDPMFKPYAVEDLNREYVARYPYSSRQAPFAVICDLNGDGVPDVAMMGKGRVAAFLAILSDGGAAKFRVVEIRAGGAGDALYLQKPGNIRALPELEAEPLELKTDGIMVAYGEVASELFYWKNGKFDVYATGD